jgi:aminopeptidase N
MYRTLLGEEGFKAGLKLYFARHDGNAVTCDDFRSAMAGSFVCLLVSFICQYD